MRDELIFDGKKFISSNVAARRTGYAPDYIGQLCRSGKLLCRRVGRSWFVSEEAIATYKSLNLNSDPSKAERFHRPAPTPAPSVTQSPPPAEPPPGAPPVCDARRARVIPRRFTVPTDYGEVGHGLPRRSLLEPDFFIKCATFLVSVGLVFGSYGFAASEYPERVRAAASVALTRIAERGATLAHALPAQTERLRRETIYAVGMARFAAEDFTLSVFENLSAVRRAAPVEFAAFRADPGGYVLRMGSDIRVFATLVGASARERARLLPSNLASSLRLVRASFLSVSERLAAGSAQVAVHSSDAAAHLLAAADAASRSVVESLALATKDAIDGFASRAAGGWRALAHAVTRGVRDARDAAVSGARSFVIALRSLSVRPPSVAPASTSRDSESIIPPFLPPKSEGKEEKEISPNLAITERKSVLAVPSEQATPTFIDRTVERVIIGDISRKEVEERLASLQSRLAADIAAVRGTTIQTAAATQANTTYINNVYNTVAQTNNLDRVGDLDLDDPTILRGTMSRTEVSNIFGSFTSLSGSTLTLSDGETIRGDLTVYGTITSPVIFATSTSATSTFAGGLTVQTDKLVIESQSGNIGLGTTSPQARLALSGYANSTNPLLLISTSTPTATSTALIVTSTGNIGIATSTPGGFFSVAASTPTPAFLLNQTGTGDLFTLQDGGATALTVKDGGFTSLGTSTPYSRLSVWGAGTGANRLFELTNSASTTLVSFLENGTGFFLGSLGLGTTSPSSLLSVQGNLYTSGRGFFGDTLTATSTTLLATAGGNVGIGTTSPSSLLSVHGNALISGTTTVGHLIATSTVAIGDASGSRFLVTQGGNVGVASTSPWGLLSITPNGISGPAFAIGSSTATKFLVTNGGRLAMGTTSAGALVDLVQDVNGEILIRGRRVTDTSPSGDLLRFTSADGATNLFRVDNSGNIVGGGIISTGAISILSTSTPQLRVQYDASNEVTTTVTSAGVTTYGFNGTTPLGRWTPQTNSVNTFSFTDAASASILSVDTTNQRVGIGTTTPWAKLSVAGVSALSNMPLFTVSSSTLSATTTVFHIDSAGNVGIGTTSPGTLLSVHGNALVSGALSAAGLTATGTIAFNPAARTSGATPYLTLTGAADTDLTASTEVPDIQWNLARAKTHATGAITLQRDILVNAATHASAGYGSNFTDLATLGITGAPFSGTNATTTNAHTLLLSASALNASTTNSYGLTVNANTGAGSNYAAAFLGGNTGFGTTSPARLLSVHGQCVTGDTRLRRRRRKKGKGGGKRSDLKSGERSDLEESDFIYDEVQIKDINEGDEIASLDERTGAIVWSKVNALMDMGVKPIYRLTTASGKRIRTTGNHPYLVRSLYQTLYRFEVDQSVRIEELARDSVIGIANAEHSFTAVIPRKLKRRLYELTRRESGAVKFFAPRLFARGIAAALREVPFAVHELVIDIEYPAYERVIVRTINEAFPAVSVFFTPVGKQSPAHFAAYGVFAKKEKASLRVTASHVEHKTQDSRRTVTPLDKSQTIRSPHRLSSVHSIANANRLSSTPVNRAATVKAGRWIKAAQIREGAEIAVLAPDGKIAVWESIAKIERLSEEQVYDIEVEGTHNFVGNDIIAHNTYLSGDTFIGGALTASSTSITLSGLGTSMLASINASGNLVATSTPTLAAFFATSTTATSTIAGGLAIETSGLVYDFSTNNVGIGTAGPSDALHLVSGTNASVLISGFGDNTVDSRVVIRKAQGTSASPSVILNGDNVSRFVSQAYDGAAYRTAAEIRVAIDGVPGSADMPGRLQFFTTADGESGPTERMRIDNAGNVGIGTTTPGALLSVAGAGLFNSAITSYGTLTIPSFAATSTTATSTIAGGLAIETSGLVYDFSSNNVGIGTAAPTNLLTVNGVLRLQQGGDQNNPAIYFRTQAQGNGIFAPADNTLAFTTNDAERVRIDSSGNVGIGTTSPASPLSVQGNALISGTSTVGALIATSTLYVGGNTGSKLIVTGSRNVGVGTTSPWGLLSVNPSGISGPEFVIGSSSATHFVVTTEGSVGINTATPNLAGFGGGLFTVFALNGANNNANIQLVGNSILSANPIGRIDFAHSTTSSAYYSVARFEARRASADDAADLLFLTAQSGSAAAERMRILSTGNVGIGTTTPNSVLSVANTGTRQLMLTDTDGGTDLKHMFIESADGTLRFGEFNDALATAAERMRIDASGNVGIGTTTPRKLLSIAGNDPSFEIYSTANTPQLIFSQNGGASTSRNWALKTNNNVAGNLDILVSSTVTGDPGTSVMHLTSAGNVGIGTTSPASLLSVHGNGLVSGTLSTAGLIATSSTITFSGLGANMLTSINASGNLVATSTPTLSHFFATSTTATSTIAGGLAIETSGLVYDFSTNNVGIGTASPGSELEVIGASAANSLVTFASGSGLSTDLVLRVLGDTSPVTERFSVTRGGLTTITSAATNGLITSGGRVGFNDTSPDFNLETVGTAGSGYFGVTNSTDGDIFIINGSGNVGIGTTTPASLFSVHGNSLLAGTTTVRGLIATSTIALPGLATQSGSGDVLCVLSGGDAVKDDTPSTACSGASSVTVKHDITTLSSQENLRDILALRPVSFVYNADYKPHDGSVHLGFIAEEVAPIDSRLIEMDGTLPGLKYTEVIPKLVGAVQAIGEVIDLSSASTSVSSIFVASTTNIGIGTTTPTHKLTVAGDVAATGFVNLSSREYKTDITYLTDDDKRTVLEKLRTLGVATYRYTDEVCGSLTSTGSQTSTTTAASGNGCTKRLGLIAEEAPLEVLSADKKGVDLYKLTTFVLAGVQQLDARLTGLEMRLAKLESIIASSTPATQTNADFTRTVADYLATLGAKITNGLAEFRDVFAAKITVQNLYAQTLIVGTGERPSGITLYDELSGTPYCLRIRGGQPMSTSGTCGLNTEPTQNSSASVPSSETSVSSVDSTPPVLTVNGNNPASIEVGANYADLGATVSDNINGNLGVYAIVNGVDVGGISNIQLSTASSSTYTIEYYAVDQAGNRGSATRTVVVGDGGSVASSGTTDTTTTGTTDTATASTTPMTSETAPVETATSSTDTASTTPTASTDTSIATTTASTGGTSSI